MECRKIGDSGSSAVGASALNLSQIDGSNRLIPDLGYLLLDGGTEHAHSMLEGSH